MQLFTWLLKRMTGRSQTRSTPARKPGPRFRPQFESLERRDVPSTLTVTNNLDSGAGSLRADIAAAKSNDTIVFAPTLAGKTITLTSGELDITKNLTIQGPGAGKLSISGGDVSRVFEVDGAKKTVTLSGLTITHGRSGAGGGILNYGILTVSNCTVSYNYGGQGGGINNDFGTVTLTNCTLSHNYADEGAGFYNFGNASLSGCTLIDNGAGSEGGGIFTAGGLYSLSVSGCTFTSSPPEIGMAQFANNYGGGIYILAGTVTVSNCTFTSNRASVGGGGAIFSYSGKLTVSGSVFTDPYNYNHYFGNIQDYIAGVYSSGNGGVYTDGGGNTFK